MSIRVAIFEDNRKFRKSLAVLISGSPGFELAGDFPNALDASAKIASSKPNVVLMDIEMPGMSGLEALREIKKQYPDLNVLIQTAFDDDDKIFEAIVQGASGYILKNSTPARMLDAIAETCQGGAPMSPVIAKKVLKLMQERNPVDRSGNESIRLTPREKDVLAHMVKGLSYKMIADQCGISFETVRYHINNIYVKLHVGTMTEAVAKAIKQNLV